jgi:hypothetical protein
MYRQSSFLENTISPIIAKKKKKQIAEPWFTQKQVRSGEH